MPAKTTIWIIYEYLRGILAPDYQTPGTDDAYIDREFLEELRGASDCNCIRLLASLGIDFRNYEKPGIDDEQRKAFTVIVRKIILHIRELTKLPKSYPEKALTVATKFAISLKDFDAQDLRPAISIQENAEYVRISSFESYLRYVVAKNTSINPSLPATIDMDKPGRYYWMLTNKRRYDKIKISQLGSRTGWVFLAHGKDLASPIANKNVESLLDNLGFYLHEIKPNDQYISFTYPDSFGEMLFQPTTLTGDWGFADDTTISFGNEFFLSYKLEDFWGRTFSVSGSEKQIKERVHRSLNGADQKTYTFSVDALGPLSNRILRADITQILEEAQERYLQSI
ncbi:hypothetical protein D3H65_04625 [Paraflavitalea soli]|uniref:Uncharacterized protein n=1 Tax=Paraflavitalea soli TaxID=2315862 RepID=A0A3B7MJV0_9BACT|nr:hypothetical protein [Paraflavitalea soli]AXY73306.1 hypothetical protein D3H65_04625 [Paraflavitalea soli]